MKVNEHLELFAICLFSVLFLKMNTLINIFINYDKLNPESLSWIKIFLSFNLVFNIFASAGLIFLISIYMMTVKQDSVGTFTNLKTNEVSDITPYNFFRYASLVVILLGVCINLMNIILILITI